MLTKFCIVQITRLYSPFRITCLCFFCVQIIFFWKTLIYVTAFAILPFIQDTSTFFLIENAFALFLVLLVNVAIVSITGTICDGSQLVDDNCSSLTLDSTSVLLKVSTDESLCSISCKLYIEAYQLLSVGLSYINNNPSIRNCRSFWYF